MHRCLPVENDRSMKCKCLKCCIGSSVCKLNQWKCRRLCPGMVHRVTGYRWPARALNRDRDRRVGALLTNGNAMFWRVMYMLSNGLSSKLHAITVLIIIPNGRESQHMFPAKKHLMDIIVIVCCIGWAAQQVVDVLVMESAWNTNTAYCWSDFEIRFNQIFLDYFRKHL